MPLQHWRYPRNWPAVAAALKDAADWQCQACERQCRRPGEPHVKGAQGWRHTLTVAHVWPETQAPDAEVVCVMMLCGPCHAKFDARHQAQRRYRFLRRYQMSLGAQWALQSSHRLRPDEVAELAADWPEMPDLPGGVDWWADFGVVGEAVT